MTPTPPPASPAEMAALIASQQAEIAELLALLPPHIRLQREAFKGGS